VNCCCSHYNCRTNAHTRSSRTQDYIIDTLALRRHLPKLRPLLADPAVVKVLHGADSDVQWLQRDAALYIVNMFDTGRAARR
jgi:exosome complex exonuclease RRP6